jgi:hypothetical protein
MSEVIQNLIRSITLDSFLLDVLYAAIIAGMVRVFIWVIGKVPRTEHLYWITAPLSWCVLIIVFRSMVSLPDNMPVLHGTIEEEATTDASSVYLIVSISNTGAPTIVNGYGLTASLTGGEVRTGERKIVSEHETINYPNGLKDYVYGEDSLLNRTAVLPIPRGGQVLGRLKFDFPKTRQSDLAAAGVKFTLTFRDSWGKTYSALIVNSSSVIGGESGLSEYPTIHPRTVAPPAATPCTDGSSPKEKV